ncbi:hypothetical protein OSB04_023937 [Centaurea solstitialis]|uniref:GAG-pre-integrase domain-containing protein n=1 Tax=Centaurea solstitialis TaxID=347529 RepID=A0AA38SK51_9ASTR|nr:hypothetical protein OSB04_023937 [Centaurea solstitialis]
MYNFGVITIIVAWLVTSGQSVHSWERMERQRLGVELLRLKRRRMRSRHGQRSGLFRDCRRSREPDVMTGTVMVNSVTDEQSERTIQTIEGMLRACALDFGGLWGDYLPLIEFAYNNYYHASIEAAPCEILYERKCGTPLCRNEVGKRQLAEPDNCASINQRRQYRFKEIEIDQKMNYIEEPIVVVDHKISARPPRTENPGAKFPDSAFVIIRNSILRNHPISYALTATTRVAETYATQFLLSSYVCHHEDEGLSIIGYALHQTQKSFATLHLIVDDANSEFRVYIFLNRLNRNSSDFDSVKTVGFVIELPTLSNLRVGEGTMLVAEAVGSYTLSLPSGLVLELETSTPSNGLYIINLQESNNEIYHISKRSKDIEDQTYLWHCRLGHINKKRIELLKKGGLLGTFDFKPFSNCESCLSDKMTKQPFNKDNERANDLIEIIHTDVCGTFSHEVRKGYRYLITFTDDFSRYGYVYLMRHKSEAFEKFKEFHNEVDNSKIIHIRQMKYSGRSRENLEAEFTLFAPRGTHSRHEREARTAKIDFSHSEASRRLGFDRCMFRSAKVPFRERETDMKKKRALKETVTEPSILRQLTPQFIEDLEKFMGTQVKLNSALMQSRCEQDAAMGKFEQKQNELVKFLAEQMRRSEEEQDVIAKSLAKAQKQHDSDMRKLNWELGNFRMALAETQKLNVHLWEHLKSGDFDKRDTSSQRLEHSAAWRARQEQEEDNRNCTKTAQLDPRLQIEEIEKPVEIITIKPEDQIPNHQEDKSWMDTESDDGFWDELELFLQEDIQSEVPKEKQPIDESATEGINSVGQLVIQPEVSCLSLRIDSDSNEMILHGQELHQKMGSEATRFENDVEPSPQEDVQPIEEPPTRMLNSMDQTVIEKPWPPIEDSWIQHEVLPPWSDSDDSNEEFSWQVNTTEEYDDEDCLDGLETLMQDDQVEEPSPEHSSPKQKVCPPIIDSNESNIEYLFSKVNPRAVRCEETLAQYPFWEANCQKQLVDPTLLATHLKDLKSNSCKSNTHSAKKQDTNWSGEWYATVPGKSPKGKSLSQGPILCKSMASKRHRMNLRIASGEHEFLHFGPHPHHDRQELTKDLEAIKSRHIEIGRTLDWDFLQSIQATGPESSRMSYDIEQPAITEFRLQITSMLFLSSAKSSTLLMVL